MILFDTNVIIETYRRNQAIISLIKLMDYDKIVISDVTISELFYGARNGKELKDIEKDLLRFRAIPINIEISRMTTELIYQFSLSHNLALADALIASTAIYHNFELFTLNTKDFKFIKDLKLYQY